MSLIWYVSFENPLIKLELYNINMLYALKNEVLR